MAGWRRWAGLALAWTLLLAPPVLAQRNLPAQPGEQRVALVIGNAAYERGPLRNPVNDARAISERLQALGFTVIRRENMKAKEVGSALREFRSLLNAGATALFFYSGHGLQVRGVNYLPTVDADIDAEEDVYLQSLDVSKVLELMDEAKTRVNLVFLDACRDNPFARKFRSASRGLARLDAPSGTLISFATRPGSVASDGEGRNGLYTEHLLKHMEQPGLPIEQVLKRVGAAVKLASRGRQEPWTEGLIEGEFYFRAGTAPAASATAPAVDSSAVELSFWDSIKTSTNPNDFKAYLDQYPDGRFAALARNRLAPPAASAAPAVTTQIAAAVPSSSGLPRRTLKVQSTWPSSLTFQDHLRFVAQEIEKATGGEVKLEVFAINQYVPGAFEVFDATAKGVLDGFHAWPGYWSGKNKAAVLFGGAPGGPFGLQDTDLFSWLWDAGGQELWQELYQQQIKAPLVPLPAHPMKGVTFGWFKRPINNLADFKRMKCHQTGTTAEVFQRMGMKPVQMPGGEIIPAAQRGVIDCVTWAGGVEDLRLGLHSLWKYHYQPGIDSNSWMGEFTLSANIWNALGPAHQRTVRAVLRDAYGTWGRKFQQAQAEAMREMEEKHGVLMLWTPPSILIGAMQAWDAIASEESARNPFFARVYEVQREFARKHVASRTLTGAATYLARYYWRKKE